MFSVNLEKTNLSDRVLLRRTGSTVLHIVLQLRLVPSGQPLVYSTEQNNYCQPLAAECFFLWTFTWC